MNAIPPRGFLSMTVLALTLAVAGAHAQGAADSAALRLHSSAEWIPAAPSLDGDDGSDGQPLTVPTVDGQTTHGRGDELAVTITFTNISGSLVLDARISVAIVPGFRYADGSAQGPAAQVLYSVDGGRSFAPADELAVRQDDDERAATAADYTHIRWLLPGPFEPGVRGFVRYRAIAD